MPTILKMKPSAERARLPADGSALRPDRIAGLGQREAEDLQVLVGNRREHLGDLLEVEGDGAEEIEVEGDLSLWARVGAGMSRGRLTVRGPVGPRAGSGMRGGTLVIEGNAGDYAGEGMCGGLLRIRGDTGSHLAAPLPGREHGANRGAILVEGNAGEMAGFLMRRGTIVVAGDAGPCAGCAMLAGSLFVFGRIGPGAGALMRRGTIVSLAPCDMLPVFLPTGRSRQPFLNLYYDLIEAAGIAVPPAARAGSYHRHVGDASGSGRGEILVLGGNG
ncbi:MAG: formylmethanofuran dehydrogenase subunit C [Acidobacteria bacterium]|nr:formylmethanofuran dehydrogenase subunit C [Acidobacteriota bacterium]